jgi:hypothetical protein
MTYVDDRQSITLSDYLFGTLALGLREARGTVVLVKIFERRIERGAAVVADAGWGTVEAKQRF